MMSFTSQSYQMNYLPLTDRQLQFTVRGAYGPKILMLSDASAKKRKGATIEYANKKTDVDIKKNFWIFYLMCLTDLI